MNSTERRKQTGEPDALSINENDVFDDSGRISLSADDKRKVVSLTKSKNRYRNALLVVLMFNSLFLASKIYNVEQFLPENALNFISEGFESDFGAINQNDRPPGNYAPELLQAMGARLAELGYPNLKDKQLAQLRDRGLTATFVGQMQEAGYKLTLDEAVQLAQHNVSARFAVMMKELGYNLSIPELIRLRDSDVTANYVSLMADVGYKNLSIDQLVRLKTVGVTEQTAQRFYRQKGRMPNLEELIRFQISNQ